MMVIDSNPATHRNPVNLAGWGFPLFLNQSLAENQLHPDIRKPIDVFTV
jgi:hypothetical protein